MRKYSIYEIQCDLKESQLLKEKTDLQQAKFIIKNSIDKFPIEFKSQNSNPLYNKKTHMKYYIQALDLYAQILNETKSINPSLIIKDYLEKATNFAKENELNYDKENLVSNSFYSLGKFADEQYQTICNYIKSTSYEEHTELMRQFEIEKNKAKKIDPTSHYNYSLHKQFEIDNEELKCLNSDREEYLIKAVESYLYCLELGQYDTVNMTTNNQLQNICVFRLVALWTQNSTNNNLNKIVKEKIFKIPTYKFRQLAHQLAARMSLKSSLSKTENDEQLFQNILICLIQKITTEHPYHVLPILLAFSNSHKDLLYTNSTSKSKANTNDAQTAKFLMTEDRVNTANYLLNLIKQNLKLKEITESTQFVCEAYIELANTVVDGKNKDNSIIFPKHLSINKIKNLKLAHVLTHTMPININGNYDPNRLVHICKFENTFRLANGINLPKIIICWGSDGIARKELVKGRDDLRQDAVMQQFFETVNDLIKNNSENTNNKLCPMRTYKIVPLSQKSGVLEWCQNTCTIGDWLTAGSFKGGAHKKYEPSDWMADDCKRRLYEVGDQANKLQKLSKKVKHDTYLEICKHFKPVFRHFFMENYLESNDWFEKRLNYTRSVATSSIVGYIIGLGDRHVQNILIDLDSADLIHIDLGIAFDQGHILACPETVPFRLTRDIVDGFGICGIEGLFKNSCESVLDILKNAKEQITTIFEVLLYDPLHNWSLSPEKAIMLQRYQSDNTDLNQPESLIVINDSRSLNNTITNTNNNNENLHKTSKQIFNK